MCKKMTFLYEEHESPSGNPSKSHREYYGLEVSEYIFPST